jgi:hypothetical protein
MIELVSDFSGQEEYRYHKSDIDGYYKVFRFRGDNTAVFVASFLFENDAKTHVYMKTKEVEFEEKLG